MSAPDALIHKAATWLVEPIPEMRGMVFYVHRLLDGERLVGQLLTALEQSEAARREADEQAERHLAEADHFADLLEQRGDDRAAACRVLARISDAPGDPVLRAAARVTLAALLQPQEAP